MQDRAAQLQTFVVTAQQMRAIESRVFAAGMPVAALMEKVAGQVARRIQVLYPQPATRRVGVLVGPGHNGGDGLVVARELLFRGYEVRLWQPIAKLKDLTAQHARYVQSLGASVSDRPESLDGVDLIVDGLFGFGLERPIDGDLAAAIAHLNALPCPVVSIDLPSGLHTDTGEALGTAICADRTLCLGLWKLGLLQDRALAFVGETELVDFDLPLADIAAVLSESPGLRRITPEVALSGLPLVRQPSTHKYRQGHVLLVCGSRQYLGAMLLTALGARATGVGMVSMAVPESAKPWLVSRLPEVVAYGCPETESGAIAQLPSLDLAKFQAIACGPGLTLDAAGVMRTLLESDRPLVLDADGLNLLAQIDPIATLRSRSAPTVLTPHTGEFQRLFPETGWDRENRPQAAQAAAQATGATILLKGARTAIASPQGPVWINPESTPALARGGSGDVLTGLIGGLMAQGLANGIAPEASVRSAAWWHAQAACRAAQERTVLGVDPVTLTEALIPTLRDWAAIARPPM